MSKLICFDIGKNVGVAEVRIRANVITKKTICINSVIHYLSEENVKTPVIAVFGFPITLSGKMSKKSYYMINLVLTIRQILHIPVILWNERLTSKWSICPTHMESAYIILKSFLKGIYAC